MHKLLLATALVLTPMVVFAQSATGAGMGGAADNNIPGQGSPPASHAGVYGPPAPTIDTNAHVAATTPKQATADSPPPATRHKGHHRGSYAGTDAGIGQ